MCFICIGDELMMMMPQHYLADKNALSEFDPPKLNINIPYLRSRNLTKKNIYIYIFRPTLPELFFHVTVNTGIFFFGLIGGQTEAQIIFFKMLYIS